MREIGPAALTVEEPAPRPAQRSKIAAADRRLEARGQGRRRVRGD